jgi:hypothetical protein
VYCPSIYQPHAQAQEQDGGARPAWLWRRGFGFPVDTLAAALYSTAASPFLRRLGAMIPRDGGILDGNALRSE